MKRLEPDHKFRRWIDDMKGVLKENMLAGDCIGKKQIPGHYIRSYRVNNLYRYDHPEGYRSCYVLTEHDQMGVCPTVLDLKTHDEYNEIFGYN